MKENRQKYNKILVEFLKEVILEYPDIRFFQAVIGLMLNNQHGSLNINRFYNEEPEQTLKRIERHLTDVEDNEYIDRLNKLKEMYL